VSFVPFCVAVAGSLMFHFLGGRFEVLVIIFVVLAEILGLLGGFGEVDNSATSAPAAFDDVVQVNFLEIVFLFLIISRL
jgi:hypothetical protein